LKYPLDRICVKSNTFCASCKRKIESGIVEDVDVDVIRALIELEDKMSELREGEYVKSYRVDNNVIVLLRNNWDRTQLAKIAKALGSKLGVNVKVIPYTRDHRVLIENILSPVRVLSVNISWTPDGAEQLNVMIHIRDKGKISDVKNWESILSKIMQRNVRLVFTREV